MLVVFEGIDGTGKDMQIRKLAAFLRQKKVAYSLHAYPTKKASEAFAHLEGEENVEPGKLAGIFAGDIMSEQGKLKEELAQGLLVICNRYLHSTLAYQGVGVGFERLRQELEGKDAVVPDLVVLLDLGSKSASARKGRQKKADRFESDVAFLEQVRQNYLKEARGCFLAYKYAVIDASQAPEGIFSEIITQVEPLAMREMGAK